MTDTLQPAPLDQNGTPLAIGDTVQVHNPDPRDRGTVVRFDPVRHRSRLVRVRWEDGSEGYPLLRLLRKVEAA